MILDKTYYAGTSKCAKDLNINESIRFAVDPFSKRKVDKALAFLTMNPNKPGYCSYFESEGNAKKIFIKEAWELSRKMWR